MHELTATQGLLDLALHHAQAAGAAQVTDLYVVLGEHAHVTEDAVKFYWQQLSPGTPAQSAQLHFRPVPAAWVCVDCGCRPTEYPGEACPNCGSLRLRATSGQEFYLEAVDVQSAGEKPAVPADN